MLCYIESVSLSPSLCQSQRTTFKTRDGPTEEETRAYMITKRSTRAMTQSLISHPLEPHKYRKVKKNKLKVKCVV